MAKIAIVAFAAVYLGSLGAGSAKAESSRATQPAAAPVVCQPWESPHVTTSSLVPLFRYEGPVPNGRMVETGGRFGGEFCVSMSWSSPQQGQFYQRSDGQWVRAADARPL
ncbi:hypothetical protein BAY61_17685 [Prauserella marina]|nr:hypothetical protein BAY61_17685 [Prauserella marina]